MNELLTPPPRPTLLPCPFCNTPSQWHFERDDYGLELRPAAQSDLHVLRVGCPVDDCAGRSENYFLFNAGDEAGNAEALGDARAWAHRWNGRAGPQHRAAHILKALGIVLLGPPRKPGAAADLSAYESDFQFAKRLLRTMLNRDMGSDADCLTMLGDPYLMHDIV